MSKSPDTTKPQTLQEAVYKFARFNPYGTNTPWVRGFIEGAKWSASFVLDAYPSDDEINALAWNLKMSKHCSYCEPDRGLCAGCRCHTKAAIEAFLATRKKRLGL